MVSDDNDPAVARSVVTLLVGAFTHACPCGRFKNIKMSNGCAFCARKPEDWLPLGAEHEAAFRVGGVDAVWEMLGDLLDSSTRLGG